MHINEVVWTKTLSAQDRMTGTSPAIPGDRRTDGPQNTTWRSAIGPSKSDRIRSWAVSTCSAGT